MKRDETGMPVFIIKAQDALAPEAIKAYRELCVKYGLTAQAAEVDKAIAEIVQWQQAPGNLVKLPDHVHQPAGDRGRRARS